MITRQPEGEVALLPPVGPGQVLAYPTDTPWPTSPPPPTPTLVPGTTVTPLPLPTPPSDSAGSVTYSVMNLVNDSPAQVESVTIYSVNVDKGGVPEATPTRVINAEIPGQQLYHAPDGSRIIAQSGWGNRWVIYNDSGKIEPLFRDNSDPFGLFFGWHPDSRHVLIGADQSVERGLWLVNVDTGQHVTLLQQTPYFNLTGGAVSADGQRVIYALKPDFETPAELWLVNVNGSEPQLLHKISGVIVAIAWSPDNSKIAFFGDGLMVMDSDGSNLRTVSHNVHVDYGFHTVWSPDSSTLAFINYEVPSEQVDVFAGNTIRLVNTLTGEERLLLADGSTGNIDPTWSPDGKQLAFASTRSGTNEIWLVNLDGTNLRQLTANNQLTRFPAWFKRQ